MADNTMGASVFLTQSKFYSPAMNAAIFDGPIRIYFSQSQEALALRVYFEVEQRIKKIFTHPKDISQYLNNNIFIMLYPNSDKFSLSFGEGSGKIVFDQLEKDSVIGVCGELDELEYEPIYNEIESILVKAKAQPQVVEVDS